MTLSNLNLWPLFVQLSCFALRRMSDILVELEEERTLRMGDTEEGGVGSLPANMPSHGEATTMSKSNIDMTLTLTRSVDHKPS